MTLAPAGGQHRAEAVRVGEWLTEKHGTRTRRSWRKLCIGVDADTGQIMAATLTPKDVDDGARVGILLGQIDRPIASLTVGGAYDQDGVYRDVLVRHPDAAIVVLPRSTAVLSDAAEITSVQRDCHLQVVAKRGLMGCYRNRPPARDRGRHRHSYHEPNARSRSSTLCSHVLTVR